MEETQSSVKLAPPQLNALGPVLPRHGEIFRRVFISCPWPILLVAAQNHKVLLANEAAQKLYGYSKAQFLDLALSDLSHRDHALNLMDQAIYQDVHVKQDKTAFSVEIWYRHFDGGKDKLLVLGIRDMDANNRTKNQLKQIKTRFDLLVDNFRGFIYTISRDYELEFMNRFLIEDLGYGAIGQKCFKVLHRLNAPCPSCPRDRILSGQTASFEQQSPRDGKWYYYVSTPQMDSKGKVRSQQIIALDIHKRKTMETELVKTQNHLEQENIILKSTRVNRYGLDRIVGQSLQMQEIYNLILEVASSDASVIIFGESGTGKELVADAIHNLGKNKERPFVPVNCGGIPENLVESEFFGFKKGAFTGANIDKSGFLEIAHNGTLFLDEIGELNQNMQVKLLRAIDGDGFTPLGSNKPIKPRIRIISATNRDLKELVSKGKMRSDFYFRINVVPIYLPALRERRQDIPLLIYHFLRRFSKDRNLPHIPPHIMNALEDHDWPGNVRELQNIVHRYVALNRLDVFNGFLRKEPAGIMEELPQPAGEFKSLQDAMAAYEKKILSDHLNRYQWRQSRVAKILGINRKTLYYKIRKHGLLQS